jgi:hypothetical protein
VTHAACTPFFAVFVKVSVIKETASTMPIICQSSANAKNEKKVVQISKNHRSFLWVILERWPCFFRMIVFHCGFCTNQKKIIGEKAVQKEHKNRLGLV